MAPITLIEDFEHDDEMREIFLEEAREVVTAGKAASAELHDAPGDLNLLTTLRRAFHTLKGSSRMVGLNAFGEAAWAGEQVFNTQLAEQRAAEPPLLEFADWVLDYMGKWVEDIATHRSGGRNEREVKAAAERLGRGAPMVAAPSDIELPLGLPPDLPTSADLDLRPAASLATPEPEAKAAPEPEPRARRPVVRARPVRIRSHDRAGQHRAARGRDPGAGRRVGDVPSVRRSAQPGPASHADQRGVRQPAIGHGRPRSRQPERISRR